MITQLIEKGNCAEIKLLLVDPFYFLAPVWFRLFLFKKERKYKDELEKRMKEEEIEKGDCEPPTRKVFFFEILSDLNQAVPNHLADKSQTC